LGPLNDGETVSERKSKGRRTSKRWRFLDHKADLRIEIFGRTLADLFVNAANALSHLLIGDPQIVHQHETHVSLTADTVEDLMVEWLRELLFEYQVHGKVPAHVEILEIQETFVKAMIHFGIPRLTEPPDFEIKGVTYHGLKIGQTGKRWSTRVIFDI
jgi:SHS2 domain-containing protein